MGRENPVSETERVDVTTSGFSLHDAREVDGKKMPGAFLGWFEHAEDASHAFNHEPGFRVAEFIVRLRDGAVIARKQRHVHRCVWASLWRGSESVS